MHRAPWGGNTGRMCSSPAGLPSPGAGLNRMCTHPLTHHSRSDGRQAEKTARSSALIRNHKSVHCCESGSARRLLPPGSVSIGSPSAGAASAHTLTRTHGLHLQLHRPPWACEAAGCDANGTGWFANDLSPGFSVVAAARAPHLRVFLRKNIHPMAGDEHLKAD